MKISEAISVLAGKKLPPLAEVLATSTDPRAEQWVRRLGDQVDREGVITIARAVDCRATLRYEC